MKYRVIETIEEDGYTSIEYYIANRLQKILGEPVDIRNVTYSVKGLCKYITFMYRDKLLEIKVLSYEPIDIDEIANQFRTKEK